MLVFSDRLPSETVIYKGQNFTVEILRLTRKELRKVSRKTDYEICRPKYPKLKSDENNSSRITKSS